MGTIRTCNWCGKQYDESTIFHGAGVMKTYKYCSARCEKAANQAEQEQKEARQRERAAHDARIAEIEAEGGFRAKLLKIWRIAKWTFWIVAGLIILLAILTDNK